MLHLRLAAVLSGVREVARQIPRDFNDSSAGLTSE